MSKRLVYNALAHVTPNHHSHGFWRHPDGRHQIDFKRLDPWIELAREAERGKLDAVFLADVVGIYDPFRGGKDTSIRTAMQFPSHDPASLVSALAAATNDIGFAVTSAVFQEHPFSFARKLSTLDPLTNGRVGWNIVTSYLDNAARNFGLDALPEHDARYVWAEEYMDVVYKLWEGSWEDDALRADPESGIYAVPEKVHTIDHLGPRYKVEGPHLVEPSPQRTPLLYQAGGSEAGRNFAARHAEATFIAARDPRAAAEDVADLRARVQKFGRNPEDLKILVSFAPVIGSTEEEARRKQREMKEWLSIEALQSFWSGNLGVDLSSIEPAGRLEEIVNTNHVRGSVRAFIQSAPDGAVTFGDLLKETFSGRFPGTPEQIADEIMCYRDAGVDGFNIVPVTTLGWWTEFVDEVVPVLRRRGLIQSDYAPGVLRDKLFAQGPTLSPRHTGRSSRLWDKRDAAERLVANSSG